MVGSDVFPIENGPFLGDIRKFSGGTKSVWIRKISRISPAKCSKGSMGFVKNPMENQPNSYKKIGRSDGILKDVFFWEK